MNPTDQIKQLARTLNQMQENARKDMDTHMETIKKEGSIAGYDYLSKFVNDAKNGKSNLKDLEDIEGILNTYNTL